MTFGVRAHARLLDRADPLWWTRIDTDRLRSEYDGCILTQAFGGWWPGRRQINGVTINGDAAVFLMYPFWKTLWRIQIAKRHRRAVRAAIAGAVPA